MGSPGGIVLSLIALGAAIWGLAVFGSEDAARNEIILRVCAAVVSLLILLMLYLYWFKRIPEEWDDELRQQIESLEERLKPKLEFTWRPSDNKYLDRIDRADGVVGHTVVGRAAVKNISKADSVFGLEVSLVSYQTDDGLIHKSIDRNLINANTLQQKINLHASREANYDMFRSDSGGAVLWLGPCVGDYSEPLNPGRYYIKVTASAENMRREDALYIVEFDGHGSIKYNKLPHDGPSEPVSIGDGHSRRRAP